MHQCNRDLRKTITWYVTYNLISLWKSSWILFSLLSVDIAAVFRLSFLSSCSLAIVTSILSVQSSSWAICSNFCLMPGCEWKKSKPLKRMKLVHIYNHVSTNLTLHVHLWVRTYLKQICWTELTRIIDDQTLALINFDLNSWMDLIASKNSCFSQCLAYKTNALQQTLDVF